MISICLWTYIPSLYRHWWSVQILSLFLFWVVLYVIIEVWEFFIYSRFVVNVMLSQLQLLATLRMNDVHNVLSSVALIHSYRFMLLASFIESIHVIFGLPSFLLSSIIPSIIVYSQRTIQLQNCHFFLQGSFRLNLP